MRLQTTNNTPVDYPDLPRDAPLCVEVISASPVLPFECLADEVRALSAASLLIQLETGKPVIKLLNLTALYLNAFEVPSDRPLLESTVNYLSGLVEEPIYTPLLLLREAISQTSPEFSRRFGRHPVELERIDHFIRAIGFDTSTPQLTRPAVHISLDQLRSPGALNGGVQIPVADPIPFSRVALWWTDHDSSVDARLCRPNVDRELSRPRALVPLPYVRKANAAVTRQGVMSMGIHDVVGSACAVGFSIRSELAMLSESDYRQSLLRATFAETSDLLASWEAEPRRAYGADIASGDSP